MRSLLYVTAGILAGLLGYILSQAIINQNWVHSFEYVVFPICSAFLAASTVIAEIFLNHPTRYKMNRERLPKPLCLAIVFGMGSGLIAAYLSTKTDELLNLNPNIAIAIGWILMGVSAGFADGYSWQDRTIDGGQKERAIERLIASVGYGGLAGFMAFCVYFLTSQSQSWVSQSKELVSFLALGGFLGLFLNRAGAGVLSFALRAGAGFEFKPMQNSGDYPRIKIKSTTKLKLNCMACDDYGKPLPKAYENKIEEGISIQLPKRGEITIGSGKDSDIYVSILPERCAKVILNDRTASLEAQADQSIQIGKNRQPLREEEKRDLFHNQVLTFYDHTKANFVRFVFYDRFLDSQS
jgi:hypothetical protein